MHRLLVHLMPVSCCRCLGMRPLYHIKSETSGAGQVRPSVTAATDSPLDLWQSSHIHTCTASPHQAHPTPACPPACHSLLHWSGWRPIAHQPNWGKLLVPAHPGGGHLYSNMLRWLHPQCRTGRPNSNMHGKRSLERHHYWQMFAR
jgi:hypothetical protein